MGKRFSLRQREEVLRRLEGSGLSAAEYCRRRGLCYGTVMRWRREASALVDVSGCGSETLPAFVEIEVDPNKNTVPLPKRNTDNSAMLCVELALPGGAMLRVYENGKATKGADQS